MVFSSVAAAAMATAPGVLVNGSGLTRLLLLLLLPAGRRARAALDLDPAASARFLRQGDGDFENAVLEPRLRVLRVHAIRQRDHAGEAPVGALRPVEVLVLDLHLGSALTLDRQGVVGHLDADDTLTIEGER